MIHNIISPTNKVCLHCNDLVKNQKNLFCCSGCAIAYYLVKSLGLETYYNASKKKKSKIEWIHEKNYKNFDDDLFYKNFVTKINDDYFTQLYIEDISCYSCVLLLEKAVQKIGKGAKLEINLSSGETTCIFNPQRTKLSEIVKTIEALGYPVTPKEHTEEKTQDELIALGISIFCASNLMMLSFAEYFDIDHSIQNKFQFFLHIISFILGTICLFIGGKSLLKNALTSAKLKIAHIDQPIVFGLLYTYIYSTYETFLGNHTVYFDSLGTIIAFLMIGRFFQKKLILKAQKKLAAVYEPYLDYATIIDQIGQEKIIPIHDIKKDDLLKFVPGDLITVEGTLASDQAEVLTEPLNGEIQYLSIKKGDPVKSGFGVGAYPLLIRAQQSGSDSHLVKIKKESQLLNMEKKGFYQNFSDRMAWVFFLTLFISVTLAFIYHSYEHSIQHAIFVSLSMILVACPCAFGLSSSLIFSIAYSRSLKKGIAFRSQRSLELLSQAKSFYFDKTGTLTQNHSIVATTYVKNNLIEIAIVYAYQNSKHHVIKSLYEWLDSEKIDLKKTEQTLSLASARNFKEMFSKGVEFIIEEKNIRLGNYEFCSQNSSAENSNYDKHVEKNKFCYFSINGVTQMSWDIKENLVKNAFETIQWLKQKSKKIFIVTGDSFEHTKPIADLLLIDSINIHSRSSIEEKYKFIHQDDPIVMVGNGFNDILALSGSQVGVCTSHGTPIAKESSDIYLIKDGLNGLIEGFKISEGLNRAFTHCFLFAFIYNFIVLTLAGCGFVTPLFAACLMPLSSAVVIWISTQWKS